MSAETAQDKSATPKNPEKVDDQEGAVDSKIKQRILKSRSRIDEQEELLFAEALVNPDVTYQPTESLMVWSMAVRQYIRNIKPLLTSPKIEKAAYYWSDVGLGEETIVPPNKDGYQFSLFANPDLNDAYLKQQMGLPRGCEVPKPKTVEFNGLHSVLEKSQLNMAWTVCVDDSGSPPEHEFVTLEHASPIPKYVLENAIEAADTFLQSAGIGLKTEDGGQNVIRGFDQSGDEPEAEFDRATIDGEPGL